MGHMTAIQKLFDFFSHHKVIRYKKGEILLRPGDIPQGIFFLKKGFVRLYSISESGEELTLIIFKQYNLFPLVWAVNNAPNEYYLEAMTTPTEIFRAPKEDFLHYLSFNHDVFFFVTGRILSRLGRLLRRMEYLAFGNSYQKVASILMICAEHFGRIVNGKIIIEVLLTHKDIATMVGVTRETASLEIKKLENKGIIGYRNRLIVIKNVKKLQKESLLENPVET